MILLLLLAACGGKAPDADGDGTPDAADCGPDDAAISPDAAETCNGLDDNCDGLVDEGLPARTWYADTDGDGAGDDDRTLLSCDEPEGWAPEGGDCAPEDGAVHPGATEACNGVDDDCDGVVDGEGAEGAFTWYLDVDGDGWGDSAVTTEACEAPPHHVPDGGDCDDRDAEVHPDAGERCAPDGVDDDCDGLLDAADPDLEGGVRLHVDGDGDGYGDAAEVVACEGDAGTSEVSGDCDDTNPDAFPGAPSDCTAADLDCDGHPDDEDLDGDGWGRCEDCDETRAELNPGATEVCDGLDNNCDGAVDEATAVDAVAYYVDEDEDLYGVTAWRTYSCTPVEGAARYPGDCDDADPAVNPAASEVCGTEADDDCDGDNNDVGARGCDTWYPDGDGDGWGAGTGQCTCEPTDLYTSPGVDCDDTDATVSPGTDEVYGDGVDQDCDGYDLGHVEDFELVVEAPGPGTTFGETLEVGDLTGDGVDDLVVGDGYISYDSAAAYVYPGPITLGMSTTPFVLSDEGLTINFVGRMCAGDADGDGVDDLLLATQYTDWEDVSNSGANFLFRGPIDADRGVSAADLVVVGARDDAVGDVCAVVDDIDGDGVPEIGVGNQFAATWGGVFLTNGDRGGTVDAWSADVVVAGNSSSDNLGSALTSADLSGDGVVDLVVGGEYAGRDGTVWVFEGPLSGTVAGDAADASYTGGSSTDSYGVWAQAPGDVDGDGRGDLLVNAHDDVVLYTAYSTGDHGLSANQAVYSGVSTWGWQPNAVDDYDGDGVADLLLANIAGTPDYQGWALVFLGPHDGRREAEEAEGGWLGGSLSTSPHPVGDVDGDGRADGLIGETAEALGSGKVLLLPGSTFP